MVIEKLFGTSCRGEELEVHVEMKSWTLRRGEVLWLIGTSRRGEELDFT